MAGEKERKSSTGRRAKPDDSVDAAAEAVRSLRGQIEESRKRRDAVNESRERRESAVRRAEAAIKSLREKVPAEDERDEKKKPE